MEDGDRKSVLRQHAPKSLEASEIQAAEKLRSDLQEGLKPHLPKEMIPAQQLYLDASITAFQSALVESSREYFRGIQGAWDAVVRVVDRRPKIRLDNDFKNAAAVFSKAIALSNTSLIDHSKYQLIYDLSVGKAEAFWLHLIRGKI